MDIITTQQNGKKLYVFNLLHFLEIISSSFGWKQITIKARRVRQNKSDDSEEEQSKYKYMKDVKKIECRFLPSWLCNAWNSTKLIQQKYNQNKIKTYLKQFNDNVKLVTTANEEDWLVICRDDTI